MKARFIEQRSIAIPLGICILFMCLCPANAAMILTAAGVAQGFSLSTFASGFPSSGGVGPLGFAFPSTGGVLVTDDPGNIRLFPTDADGQSVAAVPPTHNYGSSNAIGLAQIGGNIYMTQQGIGDLVQVNNDGTLNQVIVTGMPAATGLAADPGRSLLFVSTLGNNVIYQVDPVAKTKTVFVNAVADGLSVSPDGSTLYAEVGGHILGYNIASKALVFDSGPIAGGPDGTAAGTGAFSGFVFANTNAGTLVEIDLATKAQTLLATGGTRGDFVSVDPVTDTLLLTQTSSVLRLSGATFTNTAPEPSMLGLTALGLCGVLLGGLRRNRSSSRG